VRAVVLALLACAACASASKTGGAYRDAGKHELSVPYFTAAYRADRKDDERKKDLVAGIEAALRVVQAEYDDEIGKGDARGALGAALRKEDLVSTARAAGLKELAAISAKPELERARGLASKAALAEVDRAATAGEANEAVMARLRTALALDANNPELASRYERLRLAELKNISSRVQCGNPSDASLCDMFAARLLGMLAAENREITALATAVSKSKNAEMVLTVTVRPSERPWSVVKRGKATDKVPVLNKFREPEVDAKGNKKMEAVSASYEVFQAASRAQVSVKVEIRDLGPKNAVMYQNAMDKTENDERNYVTWQGDERALGDMRKLGTDQSPPASPEELARRALDAAAAAIVKDIMSKLERGVS
jgi:hypothetical protein